jgi:small conductance mechanosensitive channel
MASAFMAFHQELIAGLRALPNWQQTALVFLCTLIGGYFVIKFGEKLVDGAIHRSRFIDATLSHFLDTLTNVIGWVLLSVVLLWVLGVPPSALAGGMAVGGFVIGFALKDTLGNLAAGVMLLFYRPFNLGDTVTIGGDSGDVIALGMSLTTIKTADAKIVTVPNGNVLGAPITNHTRSPLRRADVLVGIAYGDDIQMAVQAIMQALGDDSRVLSEPAPSVRITELGNSSVGLQVRPWVATGDYWAAKADFHRVVKDALTAAGCSIPFPQMDIRLEK